MPDDEAWLRRAIALAWNCPPSDTAFSVGAVIVSADGEPLATGYSRETGPHDHAEETALAKLTAGAGGPRPAGTPNDADQDTRAREAAAGGPRPAGEAGPAGLGPRLAGATLYSSLEPCSTRASRPRSCTELILAAGIPRVVFAWREPAVFVDGTGAERLRAAGRTVIEVPELAGEVRAVNAHLLG